LDLAGIACSAGSACSAGREGLSHVLVALGLAPAAIRGTLRFSLGRSTTRDDLAYVLDVLAETVGRLRGARPRALSLAG
jgi:cysteine desulfurase